MDLAKAMVLTNMFSVILTPSTVTLVGAPRVSMVVNLWKMLAMLPVWVYTMWFTLTRVPRLTNMVVRLIRSRTVVISRGTLATRMWAVSMQLLVLLTMTTRSDSY